MHANMNMHHLGYKFVYLDFGGHKKNNGFCLLTFALSCTGCRTFVLLWCWFGCCSNRWQGEQKQKQIMVDTPPPLFGLHSCWGCCHPTVILEMACPWHWLSTYKTLLHGIDEDTQKQRWGFVQPFKMSYLMRMYNNNPTTQKWMLISIQTFWCRYCILSAHLLCFHTSPFFILSSLPTFHFPSFSSSTQNLFHPSIQ